MDFSELMNLAASNEKGGKKKPGYSYNLSAPKKESKSKPKSEVVQRLIDEKEREKREAREREEQRRKEEEKKKIFKIPKANSTNSERKEKDKGSHKEGKSQKKSSSKDAAIVKEKLEEKIFKDLQAKNELYNVNDRARINFDGSFAVVRIAHKPKDGVPMPKRPVVTPVKETPKFNLALVKKSDNVEGKSDSSKFNSHVSSGSKESVSESVKQLKEKYGVNPDGLPKKERDKSKVSKRKEEKLKEIKKYQEKVKMREKLKLQEKKVEKPKFVKRVNQNAPPPMNFADLLKMAEKKQNEPVKVEVVKKKPKVEDERPLTKEEREWADKHKDWKEKRKSKEYQERLGKDPPIPKKDSPLPKKDVGKTDRPSNISSSRIDSPMSKNDSIKNNMKKEKRPDIHCSSQSPNINKQLKNTIPSSHKVASSDKRGYEVNHNRSNKISANSLPHNKSLTNKDRSQQSVKRKYGETHERVLDCGPSEPKKKPVPPSKPVQESSNPWDRIYGNIQKNHPKKTAKKKMVIDSDEDEYDSELDDFIDDGDDDADYSSAIRDIFGYDKRRYRDDDDDVDNMESNFASCMREEARSARLGLEEDLEDIRREEEEERRKAMKKKMMKKR